MSLTQNMQFFNKNYHMAHKLWNLFIVFSKNTYEIFETFLSSCPMRFLLIIGTLTGVKDMRKSVPPFLRIKKARPCLFHRVATIFPLVLRAGRKQSIIFRRIVCPQKRVWKNHNQNLVTLFASVSRLGAYKSHENQKELLQQQNQHSSSQDICFLTKTSFFPCHLNVKIQNHYPIYLELKYLKTWFPTQ